ncbi:hypothetical protein [Nonomuraea salmonea]|uniref:hypothetical protein n=1 Tax=Nonomuraea salmonea TaxID=46181 RepID=UPI002FE733E7
MRLYVETLISADIDRIWQATQNLDQHQRWDLRFGRITALGSGRLRYSTLGISGTAIASGDRHAADGTRTSALRFGSTHPLSPIRSGAGYWRYLPTPAGTRFLTSYDYRPPACCPAASCGGPPPGPSTGCACGWRPASPPSACCGGRSRRSPSARPPSSRPAAHSPSGRP